MAEHEFMGAARPFSARRGGQILNADLFRNPVGIALCGDLRFKFRVRAVGIDIPKQADAAALFAK